MTTRFMIEQRNEHTGDFVVSADDFAHSVGNYIELTLLEPSYSSGTTIQVDTRYKEVYIFPVRVTFSSESEPFDTFLTVLEGVAQRHWQACLEVGKTHRVRPIKHQCAGHTWYVPEIDGRQPGQVKA